MIIDEENFLAHYGILRKSGRYPWGSGEDQATRNRTFLATVDGLRKDGMSESEIARGFDMTTTQLRALKSIAGNAEKQARIGQAQKLRAKGLSNVAIGKAMGGLNESSVRSLLDPSQQDRADVLQAVSSMLKSNVDEKKFLDVGAGVENSLGITETKLKTALAVLQEDGYVVHPVQVDQVGGGNQKTTIKVLSPPGTTYRDVKANLNNIRQIQEFSEDGGHTMLGIQPPIQVSSKRINVVYGKEGAQQDGTIYVRPGVDDISMGAARYAQVRIAVDGTHYLKGMAIYKDGLPPGVDLQVHTPKADTGNKLDAMKPLKTVKQTGKIDEDNPFGAVIRQRIERDANGKERVTSALNLVGDPKKEGSGEEGTWDTWSKSLSTQLLSKQSPELAQQQLDITYDRKKREFEALKELTNSTVRRELLEKFADGADSSAVHLKAAALPRQATKVLLPITTLKESEIYAPSFRNGEMVALVRYPHGGTFEIPELTVNNRHKPAQELIGKDALDAVGIHPKVAERLSGADFDGDTVVVIPNNSGQIKTQPALKRLQGFDAKAEYKGYEGMKKMDSRGTGLEMGLISNLITDMTIKGASPDELARAVRHSMVVIDAEKHGLDYKRSAVDHGIKQLYIKYQGKASGGGATLISRAKSQERVDERKLRSPKDGGPIDPATGKLVFVTKTYVDRNGQTVTKKIRSTKLAETANAFDLVSKDRTKIEVVYAEHSNRMKALANDARKEVVSFKPPLVQKAAKEAYASEVKSLNAKLDLARRNKPLERQAQIIANAIVAQKKADHPEMDAADLKKIKSQALTVARRRTGASKNAIVPTVQEWAAIQAGAVSYNQLSQILKNSDIDAVRELATPQTRHLMTPTKTAMAATLRARGYDLAEIADHLGVSVSTLSTAL